MPRFTKIPSDAFEKLQVNAGVLATAFTPATGTLLDADILSATTGGINATCVPTYIDMAEDVDNAPKNLKEFKVIDGWECKISTTLIGASSATIQMMLGAADVTTGGVGAPDKITPRATLKSTDFKDLWWIGDRADGGMYAICLKNALSDGGFSLQTTDKGKGQFAFSVTGHSSVTAQDTVPMEFYVAEPAA